MTDLVKCSACEEPIKADALICLECGTRQLRPRSGQLRIYLGLAIFIVLEAYCLWRADNTVCLALVAAAVFSVNRLTPKSETRRMRDMTDNLLGCRNFESAMLFLGCDGRSGFAIDRRRSRICLLTNDGKKASHRIASHRDIVSVELIENGRPILTSSRASLPREHNPAPARTHSEAVVAALTGKAPTGAEIWQISVRINVRNCAIPHEVAFLPGQVAKGGIAYGKTNHTALSWYRMVDRFIQKAELEEIRARDGFREDKLRASGEVVYR